MDKRITDAAGIAAVTNGQATVTLDEVAQYLAALAPGQRPRAYAYLATGVYAGQAVTLSSMYQVEKYEADVQFAWISGLTMADFIRKA